MKTIFFFNRVIPFIFCFLLLIANQGISKNIFVRAGSNGDGTKENPIGTISDALQLAYAGDVIHVAEGVYYGAGQGGLWLIKINKLTLVGGYKKDFSERNPFKYRTILMRGVGAEDSMNECKLRGHEKWHSMVPTKASYNGEAMVRGSNEPGQDHSNFILDGFFIDGHTRNSYKIDGDLKTDIGPVKSPLIDMNKMGCKVKNCIIVNSSGPGVRLRGFGQKDNPETWPEISNCIIVNTLMEAIDFRVGDYDPTTGPNSGYAIIKNNTIAFVWEYLGEGYGLLVGRQTKLTVEKNLFLFSSYVAINNGFQNEYVKLSENCFWNNMEGNYKYWDPQTKLTLIEDDVTKLGNQNENLSKLASKKYAISKKSFGNISVDPKLKTIDKNFFEKFSNQIKSTGGGKVEWNSVNEWRSILGLPLQGSAGTGKKNYSPIYEIDFAVLTPANQELSGYGANINGPFEVYDSKTGAPSTKNYETVKFEDLISSAKLDGKDITVKVKINGKASNDKFYRSDIAATSGFYAFELGSYPNNTYIYVPKGTSALEEINNALTKKTEVTISGKAYSIEQAFKKARVSIVVDEASSGDDE